MHTFSDMQAPSSCAPHAAGLRLQPHTSLPAQCCIGHIDEQTVWGAGSAQQQGPCCTLLTAAPGFPGPGAAAPLPAAPPPHWDTATRGTGRVRRAGRHISCTCGHLTARSSCACQPECSMGHERCACKAHSARTQGCSCKVHFRNLTRFQGDEPAGAQTPGGAGHLLVYIGRGPTDIGARRSGGIWDPAGQRAPGHPQPALSHLLCTPAQPLLAQVIAVLMCGAAAAQVRSGRNPRSFCMCTACTQYVWPW